MKRIFILIIFGLLLAGCQQAQIRPELGILDWKYGDLRLVDASDTSLPNQDLIAAYTRINGHYFQMRFDFLELGDAYSQDIYIPIDSHPGGVAQISIDGAGSLETNITWDYLIEISSTGKVDIVNSRRQPVFGAALLIVRDRELGSLILSMKHDALPLAYGKTKFQVIITRPRQDYVIDKSAVYSMDTPSPARLPVLFAFWNTFDPATPATTLRSWAGAHTGPGRSRHGLRYLLESAAQTHTTVILTDLLKPETISALDYLGALPMVQTIETQGYLVVPVFNQSSEEFAQFSTGSLTENDILMGNIVLPGRLNDYFSNNQNQPSLDLLYFLNNILINGSKYFVNGGYDYAQYSKNRCPFFAQNTSSPFSNSSVLLDCKRAFIDAALTQPTALLILGGSFPDSVLGDPSVSSEIFTYINTHPWIQSLNKNDLVTNQTLLPITSLSSSNSEGTAVSRNLSAQKSSIKNNVQADVLEALQKAPANQISDLAWQVYNKLTSPGAGDLVSLNSNYIGQVGELISAAYWANQPNSISTCAQDLDHDGLNECILSNDNIFAILEPEGGYIPFVFSNDRRGIHQIIGPTWELMTGMSDPSTWRMASGVLSDPGQILGAFPDQFSNWNNYIINIEENKISLVNDNMTMRKSFTVLPDGMVIEIYNNTTAPFKGSLPLVLDTWVRFTPGWGDLYQAEQGATEFRWSIASDISVAINSTDEMSAFPFNAAHSILSSAEDPNFDYPIGHYLPFPMALVQINPSSYYSVNISIRP